MQDTVEPSVGAVRSVGGPACWCIMKCLEGATVALLRTQPYSIDQTQRGLRHTLRSSMQDSHATSSIILVLAILLTSCVVSLEHRWEAFDEQMRHEIGVKTKDYYVSQWGNPAKRTTMADGQSTWIWQFRGYGGAQGWDKSLTFRPDGVLKGFHRDYWPKEN